MTTLLLAVLAVLLSGPVPSLLSRLTRLRRVPRADMVLWQAVALAAVLSALGAGLSLVTASTLGRGRGPGWYVVALLALVLTVVVAARLLLSGHRVGTRVRVTRRRHRRLLDVVADGPVPEDLALRVLDHEAPMAYCLPGLRSRVVVSAGARRVLGPDELAAVLHHERAHLRARHDLVLEGFTVLHEAFPRLVSSDAALGEVRLLVEVLADRAASRRTGARPLARALVALAGSTAPEAALAAGGTGLVERIGLLGDTRARPLLAAAVYAAAAAVVGLPTAFVVLPWLSSLG